MMRDEGMYVAANYIFGLPMDTHDSMKRTLEFSLEMEEVQKQLESAGFVKSVLADPILMAEAMKHSVIAGRKAFKAGRMKKREYGSPSSPPKDFK